MMMKNLSNLNTSGIPYLEHWIRQHKTYIYILLVLVSLPTLVMYFLPPLLRQDVYAHFDMLQNMAWYYSFNDLELFQNDLLKTYYLDFAPLAYKALVGSASMLFDSQTFCEALSFFLTCVTILLIYAVGKISTNGTHIGGIAGVLLFLFGTALKIENFITPFWGGLQRSFAVPILLLGISGILLYEYRLLSIAIVLGALFYPPTYISLVMYAGLLIGYQIIYQRVTIKAASEKLTLFLAAIIIGFVILLYGKLNASRSWTLYSLNEAMQMQEYYPKGMFSSTLLFHNWQDYTTQFTSALNPLLCVAVVVFVWRSSRFRVEASILVVSGTIVYLIAYIFLFNIYEPIRYIHYPMLVLWFVVFPFCILELVHFLERRSFGFVVIRFISHRLTSITYITKPLAVATLVLIICISTVSVVRSKTVSLPSSGTAPEQVYDFLKMLPKNTMIAAHPIDADHIPMRTQRSTLVMHRSLDGYHKEFYEQIKTRTSAIWTAMYDSNIEGILALKKQYDVDVFLVNFKLYTHEPIDKKPYVEIFNTIRSKLGNSQPFLFKVPEKSILFRYGDFAAIDLRILDTIY